MDYYLIDQYPNFHFLDFAMISSKTISPEKAVKWSWVAVHQVDQIPPAINQLQLSASIYTKKG